MHDLRRRLLLNAFRSSDLLFMLGAFTVAFVVSGSQSSPHNLGEFLAIRVKLSNFLLVAGFTLAWHLLFASYGLYRSHRFALMTSEWWEIIKAVSVGTLVLVALAFVFDLTAVNRLFVGTFFVTALVATITARSVLRLFLSELRRRSRNLRNLVIVGCGPRGARIGEEIRRRPEFGYLLLGYIDDMAPPANPLHGGPEKLLGPIGKAPEILSELDVDEVVIALPIKSQYESISEILAGCEDLGIIVRIPFDFFELRLAKAYVDHLQDLPVLTLQTSRPSAAAAMVKRAMDVLASAAALLVLAPSLPLIALAIKLDSTGPVFFIQDRVGLGRKRFRMLKFRTMTRDSEARLNELEDKNEVQGAAFKIRNDPRVTRVGRFLRRLSVDELPQFWNVLAGNMSLVGPRPLPSRDVERINEKWQKRRFSVKPGLTCLWQVNGRHEINFEHWMEFDLQYIDNWSLKLDFEIILKTFPAAIRGVGSS